ncbi:SubName: Full=Uncharacterized protein {ECO:0000313/EMBL:CCA67921.1} [Serendipita indica DSM 11827]|uniref:Pyridoxamine 5'-phosphate oxidase Alr4036 family FMN-binding domain-containing protein n=1 Tax=Serendipita indica (strain DSM 11827) TaxID=1109443 RepID=G4T9E7_SERID|nr:SubName: Full=Uncharacterized protein {ECO:0000313/EMBL:CCA67921.1} [Serendipita indica DSM 11827]CCA67921.1 hypothetical protein PIIN_01790 [Serendipita indica DSM 11827]
MDAEPEWKLRLDDLLRNEKKAVVYTLATSEVHSDPSTADFGTIHNQPRARSVVHRSFVELYGEKKESGAVILQTTTDIRSAKTSQMRHRQNPPSSENKPDAEIVWWFSTPNVQFRLSCYTHLLPAAGHPWRDAFPIDLTGRRENGVDWEQVRVDAFNALSPFLRASFARPPPGSVLDDPEEAKTWPVELPQLDEQGADPRVKEAFEHFAVVYLEVDAVDVVDLGVVPNQRSLYRRQRQGGWAKTRLVP